MNSSWSGRRLRARSMIDRFIRQTLMSAGSARGVQQAFLTILQVVQERSSLLRPGPIGGRVPWRGIPRVLCGLLNLAFEHESSLHALVDWKPADLPRDPFRSLAEHLFSRVSLPGFLAGAWLQERTTQSRLEQKWYKHLGCGHSLRGLDLPIRSSAEMARHFLSAPDGFTIRQALRWGEARALGVAPALAREIVSTRLGDTFENNSYWHEWLEMLAVADDFDPRWIAPMFAFLNMKQRDGGVRLHVRTAQPQKRLRELIRQVQAWCGSEHDLMQTPVPRWKSLGVPPLDWHDEVGLSHWQSRELLSPLELLAEGKRMQHCVGSYARRCLAQEASIWSFRVSNYLAGHSPVMTVEVQPKTRHVVQARGMRNRPISTESRRALEVWCERVDLQLN